MSAKLAQVPVEIVLCHALSRVSASAWWDQNSLSGRSEITCTPQKCIAKCDTWQVRGAEPGAAASRSIAASWSVELPLDAIAHDLPVGSDRLARERPLGSPSASRT